MSEIKGKADRAAAELQRPPYMSRQELYDLVWAKPISTAAGELGLSDVALGKWCRKLSVPLPGRGYWQKLAAGKEVQQPPLPDPENMDIAHFKKRRRSVHSVPGANSPLHGNSREGSSGFHVQVPVALRDPHPLITRAETLLAEGHVDMGHGWLHPRYDERATCVEIHVSPGAVKRALRIMNALIKALEGMGFPVRVEARPNRRGCTIVSIENQDLSFGLQELARKVKSGKATLYGADRFEHTGDFVLCIHSGYGKDSWQLRDGVRQRLEDRLHEFIAELIQEAHKRRIAALERERWEQERKAAAEQREQEQLKLRIEAEELAKLEEMAASWRRAERIREFVTAARSSLTANGEEEPTIVGYLAWAMERANQLDPLFSLQMGLQSRRAWPEAKTTD